LVVPDYVGRQHANGRTKKEILRLLKRAIAREIFRLLTRPAPIDDYGDLRPARQAKNITLATVATHFGVPLITVSRLERGHQSQRHPAQQLPPMAHRRLTS
jgi:transposase